MSDNEPTPKKVRVADHYFTDLKNLCSALNMHPDNIKVIVSSVFMKRMNETNFIDFCLGIGAKGASDVAQVQLSVMFKYMMKEGCSEVNEVNKKKFLQFYNQEVWFHNNSRKHDIPYVDAKEHISVDMFETAYGPVDSGETEDDS